VFIKADLMDRMTTGMRPPSIPPARGEAGAAIFSYEEVPPFPGREGSQGVRYQKMMRNETPLNPPYEGGSRSGDLLLRGSPPFPGREGSQRVRYQKMMRNETPLNSPYEGEAGAAISPLPW